MSEQSTPQTKELTGSELRAATAQFVNDYVDDGCYLPSILLKDVEWRLDEDRFKMAPEEVSFFAKKGIRDSILLLRAAVDTLKSSGVADPETMMTVIEDSSAVLAAPAANTESISNQIIRELMSDSESEVEIRFGENGGLLFWSLGATGLLNIVSSTSGCPLHSAKPASSRRQTFVEKTMIKIARRQLIDDTV